MRFAKMNTKASIIVAALDDRVVAVEDRVDERVADTRQAEDDLDDRRAAHQDPHLEPDDGDDRDQGVPERVPRDHDLALHPFRARRAHVVLPEHLQHRGADHAHHDREREHGDRDRREDELAQVLDRVLVDRRVGERRHPAEHARGEEEQERREPEVGDRDADQAAHAGDVVVRAVALDGREDAEREADHDGDEEPEDARAPA